MMKRKRTPQELESTPFTVALPTHIVNDLKNMEQHTKKPVGELVATALKMFIATHGDYLAKSK